MSDVIARLQAADPFAEQPYEHADLGNVVTKITRTPAVASSVWRRFQLRFGAAVTGTTLVTIGAITALQGAGSSLPVLNFAASATTFGPLSAAETTPVAASGSAAQFALIKTSYHLRAGAHLTGATSSAPAYELIHPASPASEASRLAKVFALSGAPVFVEPDVWQVRGGRATLTYANAPLASWTFTRTLRASDLTTVRPGAVMNDRARAQALNSALDFQDQLGSPIISSATAHATLPNEPLTFSVTDVRFPVLVEGARTNLSVTFVFSPTGILLSARGPAVLLSSPYTYPVFSPRDGVRLLNTNQVTPLPSVSPRSFAVARARIQSRAGLYATLTRATISLNVFQLRDGAAWLVPVYNYTGASYGQRTTLSLLAPALNFRTNASAATPILSDTTRPSGTSNAVR